LLPEEVEAACAMSPVALLRLRVGRRHRPAALACLSSFTSWSPLSRSFPRCSSKLFIKLIGRRGFLPRRPFKSRLNRVLEPRGWLYAFVELINYCHCDYRMLDWRVLPVHCLSISIKFVALVQVGSSRGSRDLFSHAFRTVRHAIFQDRSVK